jgi:hypothetical protein
MASRNTERASSSGGFIANRFEREPSFVKS